MKKFIITEDEKKRILSLYEQSQTTTGTTTIDLGNYKDTIQDLIENMTLVFSGEVLCDVCKNLDNNDKINTIYKRIDDLILAIKTDLKNIYKRELTDGEAMEIVYNTYKTNSQKLFGTVLAALKLFTNISVSEEVSDRIANYLSKKEKGGLLNTVISEIFTKAGIKRIKLCASC